MRYEAMMGEMRSHTVQQWLAEVISALQDGEADRPCALTRAEAQHLAQSGAGFP